MKSKLGAVLLTAALSLSACEKSKPAPPPPAAAEKTGAGHAAQEHAHAAPHGGVVASTRAGHLELVASREGTFKLYVLDAQLQAQPVTGGTATLKLTVPDYADVKLSPEGDALAGRGQPFQAEHATAVVSVTVGGATQTGRFELHLEHGGHGDAHAHGGAAAPTGMREHDHTPLQGGMVLMVGDLHLEVLAKPQGEVHVYLTDSFRRPLPTAGRKGTLELTTASGVRSAPLAPEPGGRYLLAKFGTFTEPQVEATLRLPVEGDPDYFISLLLDTGAASPKPGTEAAAAGDAQVAHLEVQGGYSPSRLVLKKGVPVRLEVLRKDSSECSRELRIPEFGIAQELAPLKKTVVTFTPTKAGTFSFSCGMDMLRGTLVVEG
ncbi:cupredoxin domain-containing protein [Myxococcaceae bacterium GXIMD 01537]